VSPPPTKPGRLSDAARHLVLPEGIAATGWPAVRDTCAGFGVTFDPWQDGAGRVILSKRSDGAYACGIGGVVMSIPRQVGKTFLIGAVVFALCLLHPGLTVLWTAHRLRTANETFAKMQAFARRKKVRGHVAKVVLTNGGQEIKFTNGSRILFGSRERGFGRGFDDVDVEVFDEAQILTESALDDMIPAMNTAANPLAIFMGTPPKPSDPSEVFTEKRKALLDGADADGALIEFGADPGCDPNDRDQWSQANPSYPLRTPASAVLRMKKNLTLDSFVREGLGIWPTADVVRSVIDPADWDALMIEAPPETGTVSYGVKFSPDGLVVAVAVALVPPNGKPHVEVAHHRQLLEGTTWLEDWLTERSHNAEAIAIDGRSGAGALEEALKARGVPTRKIVRPTTDQVIAAHSLLLSAVHAQSVTAFPDPVARESVACAGRRAIGNHGGWGFESIVDGGDVTPAESIVLAHWAATTRKTATFVPRRIH
jgi:hypothetical protein